MDAVPRSSSAAAWILRGQTLSMNRAMECCFGVSCRIAWDAQSIPVGEEAFQMLPVRPPGPRAKIGWKAILALNLRGGGWVCACQ